MIFHYIASPYDIMGSSVHPCTQPYCCVKQKKTIIIVAYDYDARYCNLHFARIVTTAALYDIKYLMIAGTFSSVYMATVKGVPEQKFAIKHLIPTSSSSRIENELKFLQTLG